MFNITNRKYQAIQLYNESLTIPINQEIVGLCYFWRAEAKYKKKAYQGSIKDYLNYETIALDGQTFPDNSSIAVCYYGIGYNYLKSEKHQSAARFFEKAVKEIKPKLTRYQDKYVTNFVYPDALLRTADCYIFVRNYDKAKYYYNVIISKKYPNKD